MYMLRRFDELFLKNSVYVYHYITYKTYTFAMLKINKIMLFCNLFMGGTL